VPVRACGAVIERLGAVVSTTSERVELNDEVALRLSTFCARQ